MGSGCEMLRSILKLVAATSSATSETGVNFYVGLCMFVSPKWLNPKKPNHQNHSTIIH